MSQSGTGGGLRPRHRRAARIWPIRILSPTAPASPKCARRAQSRRRAISRRKRRIGTRCAPCICRRSESRRRSARPSARPDQRRARSWHRHRPDARTPGAARRAGGRRRSIAANASVARDAARARRPAQRAIAPGRHLRVAGRTRLAMISSSCIRCCIISTIRLRAIREAARALRPGGRLLIVDFAPHEEESLRIAHAHRRLGFATARDRRLSGRRRPRRRSAPRTRPAAAAKRQRSPFRSGSAAIDASTLILFL